jgi:hypothetical protein
MAWCSEFFRFLGIEKGCGLRCGAGHVDGSVVWHMLMAAASSPKQPGWISRLQTAREAQCSDPVLFELLAVLQSATWLQRYLLACQMVGLQLQIRSFPQLVTYLLGSAWALVRCFQRRQGTHPPMLMYTVQLGRLTAGYTDDVWHGLLPVARPRLNFTKPYMATRPQHICTLLSRGYNADM